MPAILFDFYKQLQIGNLLFLVLGEEGVSNIIIIVITLLCVKILDCHFFHNLK